VEVFKTLRCGTEARIAILSAGQWFGEMSVLDVRPRSASVRALSPCVLLVVTARDLDALYRRDLRSYTLLVLNVARELARRLRLVDEMVADFIAHVRDHHIGYG
jgi:CRP-like cAMP-binding protein